MLRLLTLALAAALALPAAASATTDAAGRSELVVASRANKALSRKHVKVRFSGAIRSGRTWRSPITTFGNDAWKLGGSLIFKRGKDSLVMRDLRIEHSGETATLLSGTINGQYAPFFLIDSMKATQSTDGLDRRLGSYRVQLSVIGTSVLGAKFGTRFKVKTTFASLRLTVQSAATHLAISTDAAAALTTQGIAIEPIEPAVETGPATAPTVQLPISNRSGKVSTTAPITYDGGLAFVASSRRIEFRSLAQQPKSGAVTAMGPSGAIDLLATSGGRSRTFGLQRLWTGATAGLTATAVDQINAALGTQLAPPAGTLALGSLETVALR